MKVSNETKVGALTVISVTLLVLGYNFLKGKNLVRKSDVIYARFADVGSLEVSNPVKINGFRIGNVYEIDNYDKNVSEVVVAINLSEEVNIPENSVAYVNGTLTGGSSVIIVPGNSKNYIVLGDTLRSGANPDILTKLSNSVDPVLATVKNTVDTLKILLSKVNNVFDNSTQNNLRSVIAHLNETSANLAVLLNSKNGALARTLANAETFTGNLNTNNENLNTAITNLKNTTQQLSEAQFKETIQNLNRTVAQLQTMLTKVNNGEGSLGLLVNDPKLYNSLQSTSRSLNTLLDDFKLHPKRYVSVSVFGKKDKTEPLKAPLSDTPHVQKP
jgi:phospholipid/cholesterol/gamma-HCH transport system substrate-binding protein